MPPIDQSADGDENTQIGGDGNVAGRDITNIIQGVPPSEHAKALAQIEILNEKLAISQAADKEDPTEEEVLAAEEALRTAEELEEIGVLLGRMEKARLSRAVKLTKIKNPTLRKTRAFLKEPITSFYTTGNTAVLKLNFPQLGKACILFFFIGTFAALLTSPLESDNEPSDIEACYAGETTPEEMGFPGSTCGEIESRAENEMLLIMASWCCFLPVGIWSLWIASSKSNSDTELESATDQADAEQQDRGEQIE